VYTAAHPAAPNKGMSDIVLSNAIFVIALSINLLKLLTDSPML
jgi:hypothetical protein